MCYWTLHTGTAQLYSKSSVPVTLWADQLERWNGQTVFQLKDLQLKFDYYSKAVYDGVEMLTMAEVLLYSSIARSCGGQVNKGKC